MTGVSRSVVAPLLALALAGCAWLRPPAPSPAERRTLEVTASAYNSVGSQTDHNPSVTAFGLVLRPGMRIVAVSRDLEALGLREGVALRIDGIEGEWRVGDRMHARWERKIDIYMGDDVERARRWGVRRVNIRW